MASASEPGVNEANLQQLRHDLLNPLNVLIGATAALGQSELSDAQRAWVQLLMSTTDRLRDIIEKIESYRQSPKIDGRARFADLLSIAAARVGKPFDRQRLVRAIVAVAGDRPLRILLVDDSPELVQLVHAYVADTGWQLDVVGNGERAIAQATTKQYDVVLMDIDLPGLDGATAAHAIRATDLARGASPTPIIAMTAFDPGESSAIPGREPWLTDHMTGAMDSETVRIDDPEIAPLVPEFLENRRADVRAFREALQSRAFAHIESGGHKMKGTGRGYGFTAISRIGEDLEVAAHQQDVEKVSALIDDLDDYLARVKWVG